MQLTIHQSRFQAGGTLAAGKLYIRRSADEELERRLTEGHFCAVLAPRQIGKSSLQVRTADRLSALGVRCVKIDLTTIGTTEVSAESFYASLCKLIARQLQLPDGEGPFRRGAALAPAARWVEFLREQVLRDPRGPIVIFIDEVDSIRSCPFRDEFFAAVRALYNQRSSDPAFAALTFCLIGAALPSELIQDARRTPFNIGCCITLHDFTRPQLAAFAPELRPAGGDPERLLDAIFRWTAGHPYMTQRVCEALVELGPQAGDEEERVEALVQELFLSPRSSEKALESAERCFRGPGTTKLLSLYKRVRAGEPVLAQPQDANQMALRMTGLVAERERGGALWLEVRNRVFERRFDPAWVCCTESDQLIAQPLHRWTELGQHRDFLLRGAALQEALRWAEQVNLSVEERHYLEAAQAAERRERAHQQSTLFGTEVLKSFALTLALSAVAPSVRGQLGEGALSAALTLMFFAPLLGGLWSDLRLGHRRSVLLGLGLLFISYLLLATPARSAMAAGLAALVLGNMFYKPSYLALVGSIRAKEDPEQDTSFLLCYLAISLGSLTARLLLPSLGDKHSLAVAVMAMIACYSTFQRHLDREPYFKPVPELWRWLRDDRSLLSRRSTLVLGLSAIVVLFIPAFNHAEKLLSECIARRDVPAPVQVLVLSFLARQVQKPEVMLSLLPLLLGPLLCWLFARLRRGHREPTTLAKLQIAMVLTALSFGVTFAAPGGVGTGLLLAAAVCLCLAELLLVPVGFTLVLKLAPARYVATMMGVWSATIAIGNSLSRPFEGLEGRWSHRGFLVFFMMLTLFCLTLLRRFAGLVVKGRLEEFVNVARRDRSSRHANA